MGMRGVSLRLVVWVAVLVWRPDTKQSRSSQSTYYIGYLWLDLAVGVSGAAVGNRLGRARGIRCQINQDESSQGRLTPEHGDPTSERDSWVAGPNGWRWSGSTLGTANGVAI